MATPTALPVPSTDPNDFVYNAERMDEALNSSALTYTDRLGVSRQTVAGAVATIKAFTDRGAWVTATAYAVKDLVQESGTWYVCVEAHTSSALFATDKATKWRVYQGVLDADLSVADYTALRAYVGDSTRIYVTGYLVTAAPSGIAGMFVRDDADVTSADNGGTIIVDADGRRWKRQFDVYMSVKWFGAVGDAITDDGAACQACINAAAPTAAEYAGAAQEELKRARYKVLFPDGGYLITATLYTYEGSWVEFAPRAYLKFGADNIFGFSTVNRPGQTNPNSGVERVALRNVRVDMNFMGNAALLMQSLRESEIYMPYVWNVPAGTFEYDDGNGSGAHTYPKGPYIFKGIDAPNGGTYYNRLYKLSGRNEISDGILGECGLWIGTTGLGDGSYANFNEIVSPYFIGMKLKIDLDNGNDNVIWLPEVSNGAWVAGTIGIRVGNPLNAEAAKRNKIYMTYMENLDIGIHLTSKSSATQIKGKGSTSGTTTELLDEGTNTAFEDNEIGSGSARFFRREIRGVTQIKFAAVQVPSSDPNTFDDCEKGSYTPSVTCLGTAPSSVTYTSQSGRYTKLTDCVTYTEIVAWSAMGGAPAGQMELRGMPFTPAVSPASVAQVYLNSGAAAGGAYLQGVFTATGISLSRFDGTTVSTWDADTALSLRCSGHYYV